MTRSKESDDTHSGTKKMRHGGKTDDSVGGLVALDDSWHSAFLARVAESAKSATIVNLPSETPHDARLYGRPRSIYRDNYI